MGWYIDDYLTPKMEREEEDALKKRLEEFSIQDLNMLMALKQGTINWFQFLEYIREAK
jgi:hypothetical protein